MRAVWRRGANGQASIEYVGLVLLVAVLLAGIVSVSLDLGGVVSAGYRTALCRMLDVPCRGSGPDASEAASGSGSPGGGAGAGDQHDSSSVSRFFGGVLDGARDALTGGVSAVGDVGNTVGGWLKTGGTTVWHAIKGIGFGVKDDAVGIYDVFRHPVDTFSAIKDLVVQTATQQGATFASRWQSGDHWGAIKGAVTDGFTTEFDLLSQLVIDDGVKGDWRSGDRAQAVGRVIWNVGSFFIPGAGWALRAGKGLKIVSVAAKAAKAAKVAAKAGKAGKVGTALAAAEKAEKAARKAEELARKNPTAKNLRAAREARQAANEARAAAKSAQVNKAIDDNLKSTSPGERLEGQAGDAVRDHVVDVNRVVVDDTGKRVGEIDVETKKTIIESTVSPKGKVSQIKKYQSKLFNPQGKAVIIYAPKYGKHATRSAEQAGAYVVHSPAELQALLKKLGEG